MEMQRWPTENLVEKLVLGLSRIMPRRHFSKKSLSRGARHGGDLLESPRTRDNSHR